MLFAFAVHLSAGEFARTHTVPAGNAIVVIHSAYVIFSHNRLIVAILGASLAINAVIR